MKNGTQTRGRAARLALIVVVVAAAASAFSLGTPTAGAAVGDCVPGFDWGTPRADLATQVVDLVNQHRRSIGRAELQVSPTLTNSAVWKARHMARYAYMAHNDPAPPVARSVGDRLAACGYPLNAGWGENIAYGYASAAAVMEAWLNSPGHRSNIENASYRAIGVGAAMASNGRFYWAQNFGTAADGGSGGGGGGVTAPTVTLSGSLPPASTTSTSASFAWTTTGSPTSTTCSLDAGASVSCSSPRAYSGLAPGTHTFRVTVANSGGSNSATYNWTIVSGATPAPTVTLTTAPPASTTSTGASFAWTTTGSPTSTTCSLDTGPSVSCSSPRSYSGLAPGTHTFRVTVANSGGSNSATYNWTITSQGGGGGTTVPTVTFTKTPAGGARTGTFAWTATGSPTSVICRLDSGPWTPCTSPTTVSVATAGVHSFRVEAANALGTGWRTYYWQAF